MPSRLTLSVRLALLTGVGLSALLVGAPGAAAGSYTVSVCGDAPGYQSQAFSQFANRGMRWKRACDPEGGPTLRGLVTSNVIRKGRVKRGAQSRFVFTAPSNTTFSAVKWSGYWRRRDCRYALQVYALRPNGPPEVIRNRAANKKCPRGVRAQASQVRGTRTKYKNIAGATRIVQRAVCVGARRKSFCSARSFNGITTYRAQATVIDTSLPGVGIVADNPFTRGAWVRGDQSVAYNALDNTGIKRAQALVGGSDAGSDLRPCDYTRPAPCTNGSGRIAINTKTLLEGSKPLLVRAVDGADNMANSAPVTVRVDNTAPAGVPLSLEGGEAWRSENSYAVGWANPAEVDRAPIVAAHWRICRPNGTACVTGSQPGAGVARLAGLRAPAEGEWDLRVVRQDAAGNQNQSYSSPPVRLRLDSSAPTLNFQSAAVTDPTQVAVAVNDRVSAVAGGQIELSREGSNVWQALPTRLEGGRLVARIDDAALPAGRYLLRGQARDLAGNVGVAASTSAITLPLRMQPTMRAVAVVTEVVRKKIGTGKNRRTVRRRVTLLRPDARVRYGDAVTIAGRVTNREGRPLPGLAVQVFASGPSGEQLLANLTTDAQGGYTFRATGSATRTIRFVFAGSLVVLPTSAQVSLTVPAAGSFKPSRKRLLNGGRLVFRGRVLSLPLPATGKLVELQVKQPSGEWTTFRTMRSDAQGRWALRYRFRRVRCHTRYLLRASIPAEAGYPFAPAHTRSRTVLVRGAEGPCP